MATADQYIKDIVNIPLKKYANFSDADNDYKEQIKLEFGKNEINFFNQLLDLSNKYRDWSKKFENKISWN